MANNTPTPKELADWLTHAGAVATGKVRRNYDAIIEALLSMQPDPATEAASRAAEPPAPDYQAMQDAQFAVAKPPTVPRDAGSELPTERTPYTPNWNLLYNELDCTRLSGDIVADAAKEIADLREKLAAAEEEVGRLSHTLDASHSLCLKTARERNSLRAEVERLVENNRALTDELATLRTTHAPFVGDGRVLAAGVYVVGWSVDGRWSHALISNEQGLSHPACRYQFVGPLPTWGVE